METVTIAVGWILSAFFAGIGLLILWLILKGTIDLQYLVSEPDGKASMSRFQFLLFTFVIGLSLFLLTIASQPPHFPDIPPAILALLGISGGSYVVSKAITLGQAAAQENMTRERKRRPEPGRTRAKEENNGGAPVGEPASNGNDHKEPARLPQH